MAYGFSEVVDDDVGEFEEVVAAEAPDGRHGCSRATATEPQTRSSPSPTQTRSSPSPTLRPSTPYTFD